MRLNQAFHWILILCVGLIFPSCDTNPLQDSTTQKKSAPLTFSVDQSWYTGEDTMSITFTNNSSATLFLPSPNAELTIERKDGNQWQNLGTWYLTIAVVPTAKPFAHQDEFKREVEVSELVSIVGPGTYRLRQHYYTGAELTDSNQEVIYSNTFQLKAK